jgi:hypothetical protein
LHGKKKHFGIGKFETAAICCSCMGTTRRICKKYNSHFVIMWLLILKVDGGRLLTGPVQENYNVRILLTEDRRGLVSE